MPPIDPWNSGIIEMTINNIEKQERVSGKGPTRVFKCVVIGDDNSGKTSMLAARATGSILGEHLPTLFETFNDFPSEDQENETPNNSISNSSPMTVVDTANQECYDKLRTQSYMGCDVILVCFSVVSRRTAEQIRTKWLPEIQRLAPPNTPVLLVGTKADLRVDPETIENCGLGSMLSRKEGEILAKNLGLGGYVECSAIEHVGIDDVFQKAREVAWYGKLKGFSTELSMKRKIRRASSFFKYFICGKSMKDGTSVR